MSDEVTELWSEAAGIDKTLRVGTQDLPRLKMKRVEPTPFSRPLMFSRMARGEINLFTDLRVPVMKGGDDVRAALTEGIRQGFPASRTARIQAGPSRTRRRVKVPEVIRRWQGGRAILSVTDLHFRRTKFDDVIDTSALSDFNVLCTDPEFGPEFMQVIEMMTLVVSTAGNLTDNHADDCDGTNHCFLGRKLWLAWDRMEGKAAGFQDVDRDTVFDQAAFDIGKFLSLPSSRWFTVEPGQTLFLPGSLAHKVITLEHYIGVGSFHVALPGYLRCLERWIAHDTHDIVPKGLLCKVNRAVLRRLGVVKGAAAGVKERWGLEHMRRAVEEWAEDADGATKRTLLGNPFFSEFIETARRV
ncbi:MAG TPA: hypothetical protein VM864_06500 [Pyrinomonadaceae bacterium]|jgi:hypothetical protein|nr:hypothetical protein [Pyrinomonadaceae bacterium]